MTLRSQKTIGTSPPILIVSLGREGVVCPRNPHGCVCHPFSALVLPPPPAGAAVPAVRRDLPGVWPCPGEKLAALQGVHPAGARQACGEYTAPGAGGANSPLGKHWKSQNGVG